MNQPSFSVTPRLQGQFALLAWFVLVLLLLRHDAYGFEERAARALLVSWSVANQLASSVMTFGIPDLRIVLFLPVGYLWTGNVFAAKVLGAAVLALAAWLFHSWSSRRHSPESALIATGLLLISPLSFAQIDSSSAGVYLVAAIALGGWLDDRYRVTPRLFNGWFFSQMLLVVFASSLHPAGLAYPAALLFSLRSLPLDPKSRYIFAGAVSFSALLTVGMGWSEPHWFLNPFASLAGLFTGTPLADATPLMKWLPGVVALALAVVVGWIRRSYLWQDVTSRGLTIAALLGAVVGDSTWAMAVLCFILYFGTPLLLRKSEGVAVNGFMKQRGWVIALIFVISTIFMHADRTHYEYARSGLLSPQDSLIRSIATAAAHDRDVAEADNGEHHRALFIVASQWPGRTALACQCDTLPLPPVAPDPQTQLAAMHGVSFVLFDHRNPANIDLARNFANLGNQIETLSLEEGGVILRLRTSTAKPDGDKSK